MSRKVVGYQPSAGLISALMLAASLVVVIGIEGVATAMAESPKSDDYRERCESDSCGERGEVWNNG